MSIRISFVPCRSIRSVCLTAFQRYIEIESGNSYPKKRNYTTYGDILTCKLVSVTVVTEL